MAAYYNENDPKAAAWLRELIAAGEIMPGEVDERSIEDVQPADVMGFTRCHFFAGIGGWDLALQLAGWPASRPVWTGSCPCQPFSRAGRGEGFSDERHLWPTFYRLIRECQPATCFGEQVAGTAGFAWFDAVSADLERCGYACAAFDFPACSVGAPHKRQRLYWLADADTGAARRDGGAIPRAEEAASCEGTAAWNLSDRVEPGSPAYTVQLRDGSRRPIESGIHPLAHGVPARVVRLRGYGNAIVPTQAAEFVAAFQEIE